jgi:single-strand DNA-binding protein
MQSMNKVILIGRLAAKPELKQSRNGNPYTRLRLATRRLKGLKEDGANDETSGSDARHREDRFHTDWHSVFVWGTTAENCARYLNKGALVSIEGSLSYWEVAQEEQPTLFKNAIRAEQVQFLTYGSPAGEEAERVEIVEILDNIEPPRNHNAVAHPA